MAASSANHLGLFSARQFFLDFAALKALFSNAGSMPAATEAAVSFKLANSIECYFIFDVMASVAYLS